LKARHITNFSYTIYCAITFLALGLSALAINSLLPSLRRRRQVAGAVGRAFLRMAGIPLCVEGLEHLPKEPCVVVANHASYIDGLVAIAALPPEFAFVIKKEMLNVPLAGFLLRGLGSEFVERFDRHKGAADARRVLRLASTGQSLVFFPEGTFAPARAINKFLGGAFTIASRSSMPLVAAAIHGTREVLPPDSLFIFRRPIRFQILGAVPPEGARERSRQLIAQAVGEPLAT
jgi:1-acyl-sn-glycerol-3-phosphate acyltransferase